jgi:hypothetical protein
VSVRRKTATWLWCLALAGAGAGAFSCSVFPDEATLPVAVAGAAVGGSSVLPQAGIAGIDGTETTAGADAGAGDGGAPGGVGGAPPTGVAGSPDVSGGAGAAGAACASPQTIVGAVTADTWIEAAKPNATNGNDKTLSVVGGGQERRALLQLALPAVPVPAVLLRATLALYLESNADVGLALRRLTVHQLEQDVIEGRASWSHWSTGNRTWTTPGGDFGPVLAKADVPAGVSGAALTFDVTVPVEQALAAKLAELPLIVLESSAPPPAPAELAFTAKGGNASGIPALILEYCEP